jgi:Protein of unknown function (DUF2490)
MDRLIYMGLLTILTWSALAQEQVFVGAMPVFSQTGTLTNRLQYNLFVSSTIDALPTTINGTTYPATNLQTLLQPSLLYKLSPNVQLGAGYNYVQHNIFGIHITENRLWAQVAINHAAPLLPGRLTHRLRYEERYPFRVTTEQWSYATLARYQVGYTLPLYDPKKSKTGLYVSASNEFFVCWKGANNGPVSAKNALYGEDWVYAGLGYNTGKLGRVELGYLYQDLIRNAKQDHRRLHLLQLSWHTNFSLRGLESWLLTPPM